MNTVTETIEALKQLDERAKGEFLEMPGEIVFGDEGRQLILIPALEVEAVRFGAVPADFYSGARGDFCLNASGCFSLRLCHLNYLP